MLLRIFFGIHRWGEEVLESWVVEYFFDNTLFVFRSVLLLLYYSVLSKNKSSFKLVHTEFTTFKMPKMRGNLKY